MKKTNNSILKGEIAIVTYYNEDSGYSVIKVKVENSKDLKCVIGKSLSPQKGQNVVCTGSWTTHKNFGKQFSAKSIVCTLPENENGIIKYLSSGIIPGIGEVFARKLYKKFGNEILNILSSDFELVKEFLKINDSKASEMKHAWELKKESGQIISFLMDHGLGHNRALKVYEYFKKNTIDTVKKNPYIMEDVVKGIGFDTADMVAMSIGVLPDSEQRIKAFVKHKIKQEIYTSGNCYLSYIEILKSVGKELNLFDKGIEFKKIISELEYENKIAIHEGYLTLPEIFEAECTASAKIMEIINEKNNYFLNIDSELFLDFPYTDEQRKAIEKSINSKISIITGGPGVGKTTITKKIVNILDKFGFSVVLCAPTGRAAKRLTQSCESEAITIHRLLKPGYPDFKFTVNCINPIQADVVIVDECSMMDIIIFGSLMDALKPETKLILIGDSNQLPSVGPGVVFKNLIDCGLFPVSHLSEVKRQGEGSKIISLSHTINRGKAPLFENVNNPLNCYDDVFFYEESDFEKIISICKKLIVEDIPKTDGISINEVLANTQILIPGKRSKIGTESINLEIQAEIHKLEPKAFRMLKGDKVMQVKNNYELSAFNGDLGFISNVSNSGIDVVYSDSLVRYDKDCMNELQLAYAATVHKSQGSEFSNVILIVHKSLGIVLLNRSVIYTAATRAKNRLIIIGERETFNRCVFTDTKIGRKTFLKESILRRFSYID